MSGLRKELEDVVDLFGETALSEDQYLLTDIKYYRVMLTESISSASSNTNIFIESVLRTRR